MVLLGAKNKDLYPYYVRMLPTVGKQILETEHKLRKSSGQGVKIKHSKDTYKIYAYCAYIAFCVCIILKESTKSSYNSVHYRADHQMFKQLTDG